MLEAETKNLFFQRTSRIALKYVSNDYCGIDMHPRQKPASIRQTVNARLVAIKSSVRQGEFDKEKKVEYNQIRPCSELANFQNIGAISSTLAWLDSKSFTLFSKKGVWEMELRTVWERQKNRAIVVLGSLALVLVPMIGYFSAQATQPKQITFSMDGDTRKVGTKASTVEQFLAERNITVTEDDLLQPDIHAKIKDGTTITLHTRWTIPVQVDGQTKVVKTLKRDVAGALQEAGIALGKQDRVKPALTDSLSKQTTIVVTRVEEKVVQQEERLAFQELRKNDPVLSKGTTRVMQEGQEGKAIGHYKVITENGKEVSRELIKRDVITPKKDRIVAVGTAVAVQNDDKSNRVVASAAGMVSRGGKVFRPKQVLNGVTLTAYSPAGGGKHPSSPGYGRTATGVKAKAGHTIAVDPKVIPLGWWVFIDGIGYRRAEDVGGAIKGAKIDVFVGTEADAVQFGRKRNRTVYIIGPHKP